MTRAMRAEVSGDGAGHARIGEIEHRVRAVIAHRENIAQQTHAGQLRAADLESFLRQPPDERAGRVRFAGIHAGARDVNHRHRLRFRPAFHRRRSR